MIDIYIYIHTHTHTRTEGQESVDTTGSLQYRVSSDFCTSVHIVLY